MLESVRRQYEEFPEPSPAVVPIGPGQLDRTDDNYHFGWSWSRDRYCYRRSTGLRILDAGCGTGLSTLGLSRLNPGSTVLGVDATRQALDLARERVAASNAEGIDFREHDLDDPLPGSWGPFDFIVCRRVLGQSADPKRILKNLAAVLDRRGLLHITLPARVGQVPARQLREAIDAVVPAGASLRDRAEVGLDLLRSIRPDHPVRKHEAAVSGNGLPTIERFVAGYLNEAETDWALPDAIALVEDAGYRFLFAATRAPWQANRVLTTSAVPDSLKDRVNGLPPRQLAILIDALDPLLHADEYRIFACHADFEPHVPSWADESRDDPEAISRLIPHLTGLARHDDAVRPSMPNGVVYRTVTGALGQLDRRSDLLLRSTNDVNSCGQIDAQVAEQTGASESPAERLRRWLELANTGFVLLESPDPRQHVDCKHLGAILDRLDCACPRRWIRACELHGHCTITQFAPDDEKLPALAAGLKRLDIAKVAACATCPDYDPED